MKKIIGFIGVISILLAMSVSVFAGDIPENLLNEDDANLYIGKVDGVTTLEHQSMPYEENKVIYIDITPTYKYKGEIEIGVSERHTEHNFGAFIPEKDKEYLFAYIDEHNFYVYEILSRDEKYIKLADSGKYDIVQRLENYLNEGAFAMAEKERSTLGEQISFAEFLYKKPSLSSSPVEKVTLRYQDELHEVDKDEFFKIAQEIMITNVKDSMLYETSKESSVTDAYKTILYVELLDANDQLVYFGAVSRFGEVDRYALMMSRLMAKDYEMKTEDLSKLYSLFPKDVQKNIVVPDESSVKPLELPDITEKNYTPWLYGGAATIFVIAFIVGAAINKKRG